MKDLKNKVVVITGAANGLGKALAMEFYRLGAHLALIDLNQAGLEELKEKFSPDHQDISIHRLDIASPDELAPAYKEILDHHKHVDILINNAAISISQPFEEMSHSHFEHLFKVNFWGTVNCTRLFLPALKKRTESRLVNIISGFALLGFPGKAAYASSKAAIMGFTNSLKTELSGSNLKISLVIPPPMDTGIIKNNIHINEEKRELESAYLKRTGMNPDIVAKKIIKEIKKGKYRIIIGRKMYWMDLFTRLFPTWAHHLVEKRKNKIDFI